MAARDVASIDMNLDGTTLVLLASPSVDVVLVILE